MVEGRLGGSWDEGRGGAFRTMTRSQNAGEDQERHRKTEKGGVALLAALDKEGAFLFNFH